MEFFHPAENPDDALNKHILMKELPLIRRRKTPPDGNCWFHALCDQIRLHEIEGFPSDHVELRTAIVNFLPDCPRALQWIASIFGGSKAKFDGFIRTHRKPQSWIDDAGIIAQASAYYLGRTIHLVSTAQYKEDDEGFTVLDLSLIHI